MFYLVQLYLNVEDKVQPFLSYNFFNEYETHEEAFKEFRSYVDNGHYSINSDCRVTDYSVDIFNGYHKVMLIVQAATYYVCIDNLIRWAVDYLNDIWKTKWLEDQMNDLPAWYVVIGNEASEAPLDILLIEAINNKGTIAIDEADTMLSGWYSYIPTNLSHVIVAKEYIPKDTLERYSLVIQAENEEAVKEVCRDFIRLYGDEHD